MVTYTPLYIFYIYPYIYYLYISYSSTRKVKNSVLLGHYIVELAYVLGVLNVIVLLILPLPCNPIQTWL